MPQQTDNHNLADYEPGVDTSWDHSDTVTRAEERLVLFQSVDGARSNFTPHDGAFYIDDSVDPPTVSRANGSTWTEIGALGGSAASAQTITSATTADETDLLLADASGGTFDVTLPSPTVDVNVTVKKTDNSANAVGIATPSTETIDGENRIDLTAEFASRTIVSDGSNYFII